MNYKEKQSLKEVPQPSDKMYILAPDFRCLKPQPELPSSQWPHYNMKQHRAAKTTEELNKVDEIPFDKES